MAFRINGFGKVIPNAEPCEENNYLVTFKDYTDSKGRRCTDPWTNPLSEKYELYVPGVFPLDFKKHLKGDEDKPVFCQDFYIPYLTQLEPWEIESLSRINKLCFTVMQNSAIWLQKAKYLLPRVSFLSPDKCSFNAKQQFQIIFKAIQYRNALFQSQKDHWEMKFKDMTASLTASKEDPDSLDNLNNSYLLTQQRYFGSNYNGTVGSINLSSYVGKCLIALSKIPEEFNHQTKFAKLISKAEQVAAKTASLMKPSS